MELIQNADDCSYNQGQLPTMDMTYRDGCLRVDYNEVGFTTRDVEAICKISSTKTASVDQTGEKGIGFKSVFRIANVVSVLSRNYSFQFDTTRRLGMVTPQWVEFPDGARPGFTSIHLRIRDEDDKSELIQELKSMGPGRLLFLRRLRRVNILIQAKDGTIWRTSLGRNDKEYLNSSEPRSITTLFRDSDCQDYWIYQHVVKKLPPEPRRTHCPESVIALGFPVSTDPRLGFKPMIGPQQVHAILPIRDYGFTVSQMRRPGLHHANLVRTSS